MVYLFGGETTVHFGALTSTGSKGGRNQEMVLAFFKKILEYNNSNVLPKSLCYAFFSLGTDGQDGPTDAAGACVTNEDLAYGLHSELTAYLESKNSYHFWSKFRGGQNHIKIGKTGTNLMDVQILYVSSDRI